MKLSHKIFSILITTYFLSFLAQAGESSDANANTVRNSNISHVAVNIGKQDVPSSTNMYTNSRVYVAQGGGDGGFPPDPQLAQTVNATKYCVFGYCFSAIWP